jgi:hypothetical protein
MSIFNKPNTLSPFVYDSKNILNGYNIDSKKKTDIKELESDDKNVSVQNKSDCLEYQNKPESIDNSIKHDSDTKIEITKKSSAKEELRKTRMQYFEQLNNKTTVDEKTDSRPHIIFSDETKDNLLQSDPLTKIKDCGKSVKFENNNLVDLHKIDRYKKILESDLETNLLIIEQLRYIENIKKTKCNECKTFKILYLENTECYLDHLLDQIHRVNQENERLNLLIEILNQ